MGTNQVIARVVGGGLAAWQVELALQLLLRDVCFDFPVKDLARRCGLSRSHFTRAFKVSLGLTPHRWLVRQRLHQAEQLLALTDERISLIALTCGFADQSHLTRQFHAALGTSPAAWRRRRKADIDSGETDA